MDPTNRTSGYILGKLGFENKIVNILVRTDYGLIHLGPLMYIYNSEKVFINVTNGVSPTQRYSISYTNTDK